MTEAFLAAGAAFWAGLFSVARRSGNRGELLRVAGGLVLGALCARLGWVAVQPAPSFALFLAAGSGFTLGLVPAGLVLLSLRSLALGRPAVVAPAFAALPLACALARLGCVAAGCCPGTVPYLPHGIEILGFLGLYLAASRAAPSIVPALVLGGFGSIRLLAVATRAGLDEGARTMLVLGALFWVVLGGCLAARVLRARVSVRALRGGRRPPAVPGARADPRIRGGSRRLASG